MVRRVLRDPELIDKSELSGRNNHNGREADSCEGLSSALVFKEIKNQEEIDKEIAKTYDTLSDARC